MFSFMLLIKFNVISILWSFSINLSSILIKFKVFNNFNIFRFTLIFLLKIFHTLWLDILIKKLLLASEIINTLLVWFDIIFLNKHSFFKKNS